MAKRNKRERPAFKAALSDVTPKDKGIVVSMHRFRWKELHGNTPTEKMIRMVRFIWMRDTLTWTQRNALHSTILGACMRQGLIEHDSAKLIVTNAGKDALGV